MEPTYYKFMHALRVDEEREIGLYKDTKNKKVVVIKKINMNTCCRIEPLLDDQPVVYLDPFTEFYLLRHFKKHPNIVRCLNDYYEDGCLCFVTEYCGNGDLHDAVMNSNQELSLPTIQTYFAQILNAVASIHAHGYAHRNLCLKHILLDNENKCRVSHFGFSTFQQNTLPEACGENCYMAPEMFRGRRYSPPKADMWSLGVILFMMITGFPLLQEPSEKDCSFVLLQTEGVEGILRTWGMEERFPENVIEILNQLLSIDPESRITSKELQKNAWIKQTHGSIIPGFLSFFKSS